LEVTSISEDLAAKGIAVPHSSGHRLNVWEYLFKKDIPAYVQINRIQEILLLQEKFREKEVRKKREPNRTGTVQYIMPMRFYNRHGGNEGGEVLKGLSYEAWIKWHHAKPSALHVNLIELVPPT
jgi:hypothetical protein